MTIYKNEELTDGILEIFYTRNKNNTFNYNIKFIDYKEINTNYNLLNMNGDRGFLKHIITNNIFYILFNDKKNTLEIITYDNSLSICGSIITN